MKYYIEIDKPKRNTASGKAPKDLYELCEKAGMCKFTMPMLSDKNAVIKFFGFLFLFPYSWHKLKITLKDGDVIFYQHPLYGARTGAYGNRIAQYYIKKIQRSQKCRFIALIHDLESLRGGIEGVVLDNKYNSRRADNTLLKCFDVIISHNKHMTNYLVSQGFDPRRIVDLEIFDYLCDYERKSVSREIRPTIAIAGNLAIGKCAYIYQILGDGKKNNPNLCIHLYGSNFDSDHSQQDMIYHGSFSPDELPQYLQGDFGLVWDGPSAQTCEGNTGEYLKYNDPHKTSLYLASGMPVIVWTQSAMADFILENKVGIAVESLMGLDEVIMNITDDEYYDMRKNAYDIGRKIGTGYYFTTALNKCFKILEEIQ